MHEESWNAYPYTKTKFSVPYVEKFSLEVETLFEPDNGSQVGQEESVVCAVRGAMPRGRAFRGSVASRGHGALIS